MRLVLFHQQEMILEFTVLRGLTYRHIYFVGDLHPGKYLILHATISNMSCQALNGDATMVLDNHVSYISANPHQINISG